ncbi:DUF3801 domain-containing protein [Bifidobacterium reuteri]|uniref:DUF3801 domain-containing protein n=2 Tax=Bifidobacterium reuteri TaxID=983706 RepID=UPI0005C691BA|nr:DUF3801 domain-containing protein [Bifidobacterium reuteri]
MIDERLDDAGRQAVMGLTLAGGGLTLRVGARTAAWFARTPSHLLNAMRGAVRHGRDTGRMSERRLQRLAKGDIHAIELDRDQVRSVTRSLRRAGVRYAVEYDGDVAWIHFEGRDLAHVTHAVRRALDDIGFELHLDGQNRTTTPGGDEEEGRQPAEDAGPSAPAAGRGDGQPTPRPDTSRAEPAAGRDEPQAPAKVSRADTLRRLRELIAEKLHARAGGRTPLPRHERTRAR